MTKKKGFTLAEVLVVVAIIAVLITIMMPSFAVTLARSRAIADCANIRAAYAEVMSDILLHHDDNTYSVSMTAKGNYKDVKNVTLPSNLTVVEWSAGDKITISGKDDGENITMTVEKP